MGREIRKAREETIIKFDYNSSHEYARRIPPNKKEENGIRAGGRGVENRQRERERERERERGGEVERCEVMFPLLGRSLAKVVTVVTDRLSITLSGSEEM